MHLYENSSEDAYFDELKNRFLKYELEYHKKKFSKYTYLQRKIISNEYISKKSIREISHTFNVLVSPIYKKVREREKEKKTSLNN